MSTVKCPHCGRTVGGTDAFCPFCGKRITYPSRCPVCGNELNGAKFCSKCGYKVKDKSSEVSAKAKNVFKSVWDFIKNHKKIFIIVAVVILIVAVIVIPTAISLASPFRQEKVNKIELGVTTQEDIKKKFGDPTDEYRLNAMSGWDATLLFSASQFIGEGKDVWVYYESSVAKKVEQINEKMDKAEDFDELDKLDAELEKATKKPYKSIVVAFDDDGKVTFIALNTKTKYDDSDLFATSETKTLKSVELSQNKVCIGSSISECKLSYTAKFSDKSMIKGYVTELDSAVDTSKEGAVKISFSNRWGKYSANINVVNHEMSDQDGYCTVCGKKNQAVDMEFSFDDDKDGYILTRYNGSDTDVEISATYDDGEHGKRNVIAIGNYYSDCAFRNNKTITSVYIPNSVVSIGAGAFEGCSGLTSITIPDSVTSINGNAFAYCRGLTSITIPDSVTSINDNAFAYCRGLISVTIGNGVTSIGEDAFYNCSGLTSVTIGSGVTSIGEDAFSYCSGLTEIRFNGTISQWKKIDKISSWNENTGNYKVYCTDGTLDKDGNVI